MSISLIAVDPHPIFLLGLKQLLAGEADLELLACCVTVEKARYELVRLQPQLLLVDLNLAGPGGLQLVRELRAAGSAIKVVLLTAQLDDAQAIEVLRLGVEGVVIKDMPAHLLLKCLRKVAAGGQWLEKDSLGHAIETLLLREAGARRLATILTDREIEVMTLVARGLSNRTIAQQLGVSEGTVKVHVHNIYNKLGIANRVDLTLHAQKRGLV